ncbi:hypothetical protein QKC54_gp0228 [Megavirus baoshan]|uniref:Uncharacterized protein n=1 Tax=Megavirus baoshan TaxID=2496520 RepID=A0A3S8UZ14_9VIRU|nr:hypothetical protein QKC54_gp0228 [Megavirus baoshan]AZL89963.1 hypothetical protein Mb0844 [Megavirus baoshan]
MEISYKILQQYFKYLPKYINTGDNYKISIREKYFVISFINCDYHITIYQDQWDKYEYYTHRPYHLFHISSNNDNNKCSSYFWIDKINYYIHKIPSKYFSYRQSQYGYTSSTRNPCEYQKIKSLLLFFEKNLTRILQHNLEINNRKT